LQTYRIGIRFSHAKKQDRKRKGMGPEEGYPCHGPGKCCEQARWCLHAHYFPLQTLYKILSDFSRNDDIVKGKVIISNEAVYVCMSYAERARRCDNMFHEDAREPLKDIKDTDKVQSLGEGQPMQPIDDQPSGQSADQQLHNEYSGQEPQGEPVVHNLQDVQPEEKNEGQIAPEGQQNTYRGISEQMYPSSQYLPEQNAPTQPESAAGGPDWGYPPRPEQYQNSPFGQPYAPGGPGGTRPFEQTPPGQYGSPSVTQPFAQAQPGPFGQPQPGQAVVTPHTGFGTPYQAAYNQTGTGVMTGSSPQRSGLRTGAIIALICLLAAVFGTGLFAGWQFGHTNSSSPTSPGSSSDLQPGKSSTVTVPQLTGNNVDAVREAVINKVQPGVVQILVTTASGQALGSGVVIDARGYIVTNNHVVANASSIQVTLSDGTQMVGQVAGTDSVDDLAVVKITPPAGGLTTVALGDSSQLKVGQTVLAVGSPLGNTETVTSGIVSALNRNVSEGQNQPTLPDAIQTDAPINPGNSGGALVDMQGNLVGIPTLNAIDTEFNTPANGLGFAIPSNRIQFIAKQIIADGHVTHTGRSIIGVSVTNVDADAVTKYHLSTSSGALILSVVSGSPAASAGLQASDVIGQLGNTTVHNITDLSSALLQHSPGDKVALKIYRGSQQLTVNIVLGELAVS
jgi:S1-C subfamily serine protease